MKLVNILITMCFLAQNCHEALSLPDQNRFSLVYSVKSAKLNVQFEYFSKIITNKFPRCDLIFLNFQIDSLQTSSSMFLQSFTENSKLLLDLNSLSKIKEPPLV